MRTQLPNDGCVNCGGTVRTMKAGMWICAKCMRAGRLVEAYARTGKISSPDQKVTK